MRRLTMRELLEHHGGVLPPDAVLRPDDEPDGPAGPPPTTPRRGRRSERFAALNAFADFGLAGLTGAEVKVWLVLFRDTKAAGTARTSQEDIARRAGLSRRGVQVALSGLRAKGRVVVVRRGRLADGPSAYRVRPTGPG